MNRPTTPAGASVYDTRPNCPARYHDSFSATRTNGCVCPAAKEDRRVYIKRQQFGYLQPAHVDATGTRRRLQALMAIGWPLRDLARRIGWTGNFGPILYGRAQVHRRTAETVAAVYDELWDTPGPSERSRKAAARAGYPPPAAWWDDIDDPQARPDYGQAVDTLPDDVAVEQALAGTLRFGQLSPADQVEAYRQLAARGLTGNQIRHRLHINTATLNRLATACDTADRQPADSGAAA